MAVMAATTTAVVVTVGSSEWQLARLSLSLSEVSLEISIAATPSVVGVVSSTNDELSGFSDFKSTVVYINFRV